MATEKEASLQSCASDPNFAVICSFLNQFANQCGIAHPTFRELQDMLEDTQEVSQVLIDLHIKLLRKARKSFTADKWEKALAKFCHTYSQQDGWEFERFGYKKARLGAKVKLLKVLLETQFDVNGKFKTEVNKVGAKDLRLEPLGRDQNGFQYWCQFDKSSHVRIYREDLDDETWELVASDRDGLVQLIDSLSNGEGQKELNSILNEDSTSQEAEKPITDTGQKEAKLEGEIVEKEDEEYDDDEEEEEEVEEEEDEDEDEEEELGCENQEDQKVKEREQKSERMIKQSEVVNVSQNLNEEKAAVMPIVSNIERVAFNHTVESNTSLTGVDLSIKSESKKYVNIQNDYYSPIIERPYLPERNDILSQMSAKFNEIREAEDLSINPLKKTKLDSDQPMMLVKKDIKEVIKERVGYLTNPSSAEDYQQKSDQEKPEFSDVIEEPMQHVVGLGLGVECDVGNPRMYGNLGYGDLKSEKKITKEKQEFSEVIVESIQYVVGIGSRVKCDIGNPRMDRTLEYGDSKSEKKIAKEEPEFSEVIEEPIQYFVGIGSGAECDIGNPKFCDESPPLSSYSVPTMGIECSMRNLSLVTHEPNFSDVIEEPVMFVRGFGYGQDCLTGNPDEIDESVEDKSPEKKPKLWSIDAICSSQKLLPAESLGQLSESSLKNLVAHEGSSKISEDNGPSSSLNSFDDVSTLNVCDSGDISLKPSSDVKPILENIPMKDKPPDCNVSDIGCLVPNPNKESNSHSSSYDKNIVLNKSIKDSLLSTNIDEELEVNQVSNTESVLSSADFDPDDKQSSPDQAKSSEGVHTSDDISSDNCTSDDKLTIDDQPSTDPSVIDKSSIMPTTSESDVKSFSEDNSRNSVISEEFVRCKSSMGLSIEDRDNSNMSEDCLESHSSSNILSGEERDKSDCSDVDTEMLSQRKLKKSFNDLPRAELDIESRSSVSSDKSSGKRSKCSTSSKNSNTSYSSNKSNKYVDEGVNCEKNKSQIEMCFENSKVDLLTKEVANKTNVASFENGSTVLAVANCSVVCEKLSDVSLPKQNLLSIKTSKRTSRTAKNTTSSSSQSSQKECGIVSDTDKNQNNSEALVNNPVSSDKNDEKRKNVMLTNIIEVCLDNDTNSRDNGQLNAKFNDLFSAKNLLEPSVDTIGTTKKEKTDLEDISNSFTSNLEVECDGNSRDNSRSGLKGKLNAKFSDLFSAKNLLEPSTEISNTVKREQNDPEEASHTLTSNSEVDDDSSSRDTNKSGLKGKLNAKFSDLFSVKNLNESSIKSGSAGKLDSSNEVTTKPISENFIDESYSKEKNDLEDVPNALTNNPEIESKIKHENGVSVEIKGAKEEKNLKNPVRGRKSRTNSLNNEQETEIPNKIRKTDNVQINQVRRLSRRNTRSLSQAETTLEPEEEKVMNKNKVLTKTKLKKEIIQNSVKTDTEEELSIKDVKNKIELEKIDNSEKKEGIDPKLKKEDKEDEINENTDEEIDSITPDKLNQEKYVKKDRSPSTIDSKPNKGFTLSSFSLEPPVEDGPVLGKSLDFKSLQSRKRRNSRKLSRSEEDGGEVEDEAEEEEAGGKKPRLRGKTRRSKGTPPTSHRPPPADSSSDDQAVENSEVTPTKEKDKPRRPRGRPLKKRGGACSNSVVNTSATSKSKCGKQKESEKEMSGRKKESRTDEESDSEQEEKKQAPSKKETHNKKLLNRRDSEKEETDKQTAKKTSEKEDKKQSSSKKKAKFQKKNKFDSKEPLKKGKRQSEKDNMEEDTDNEGDEEDKNISSEIKGSKYNEEENYKSEEEKPRPKKGRPKKKKTLLGLMESDLLHSKSLQNESEGSRVRQSRRIAQIKIKEEAERRAIEEATMLSLKEIKKKAKEDKQTPKKQRKKNGKTEKVSEEEDETFKEPSEEKKRGRRKKKKRGLKYDINKPWQSSSDSSSEEAEEEEEHFEEEDDEEDIRASKVVSDHEFSPESDLEKEESVEPVRRARTAKKVDEDVEKDEEADGVEDYPCKKCGQPDHPEWILLCDKCDSGYHASCLRPTLMLIPEGDWFCPPCQHVELVSKLKETLRAFERNTKRRENEELRKKRLAYVGISLANVLPTQEKPSFGGRRIRSESSESSSDESESSEEEPVYQLRQRRAALQANYRFNDYDDLINSAIQDEMEAVKGAGNMGRGKDIANIVEAEKKAAMTEDGITNEPEIRGEDEEQDENWRPPVVPKNTSLPSLRKKPKKLTDLDKQSDDDPDSDEDFKGSSEEEDYTSTEAGDSDDSIGRKQPVRRSSRTRISRIDKEFINDETESSDEPRRKKTRRIWASSSSESSDTTWGHRKRKTKSFSRIRPSKSGKKKKKKYFDSDSDRPKTKVKPKRLKIKYGISDDDEEPLRRTRGKKMSYLEVAGSDTEEEVIARSRKLISEDEEEFVPEKEEEAEADEDEVGPEEVEPEEVEPEEEIEEEEEEEEEKFEDKVNVHIEEQKKVTEEVEQTIEKKIKEVPMPEPENKQSLDNQVKLPEDEEDEEDDLVEEEEIEEEIEEEVEEEEEEDYEDGSVEEAKNLVREKVKEPKDIHPPIKIGSGVSVTKVPLPPQVIGKPNLPPSPAAAIPTPVIKEEKKEEKKEPTPSIRLVPSAKLLDPNKRRPPEESVIRGMLGGGAYYRPQPLQAPGRQPFRQRYPEQQRYLYQPPSSHHQFYPGSAYYSGEEYSIGVGYEEQIDPNIAGGDEEGVFSGLVSYFSSQREDNLDS